MARVDQQSVGDRELFSELTESPIARQSECDRELFSELTESPFAQQSVCDRELSSELTEPAIVFNGEFTSLPPRSKKAQSDAVRWDSYCMEWE